MKPVGRIDCGARIPDAARASRRASSIALATLVSLAPSFSLADQASESAGLGEIVVTARRVAEKIQDIPLTITAIGSGTIEKTGATDLRGILDQTPGVTLNGTASEAYENPVIRGQYDFNYSAFTDGQPNVAVFLDGIYLQNPNAVSVALMNIDRVEVIEGPVSALYGRNGFAGAINYVDKLPTDTFHVDALARFGEYAEYQYQANVSGPIIPGVLRAGIAYNYQYGEGPFKDLSNGNRAGGKLKNDIKGIFDFAPVEKFDVNGGVYYGKDHFGQDPLVLGANDYNCAGAPIPGQPGFVDNLQCGKFIAAPIQVASIPAASGDSGNTRTVTLAHLKASYDFGIGDLAYLAGFNKVTQREYEDFVGTDTGDILPLYRNGAPVGTNIQVFALFGSDDTTEDWSQELRFTSKQNQPLRWSFGGDFYQSHLTTSTLAGLNGMNIPAGDSISSPNNFFAAQNFVTPFGQPSPTAVTLVTVHEKQYSEFASLEYDIVPALTAGAEFRYTRDEQAEDIVFNNFAGGTANREPFGPIAPEKFDYGNYRAYVKYKFTPDVLAYVTVGTGTKAGGFNTQATGGANQTYAPEKNTTYEAGIKATFFDRRVQVNADVYHIDSRGLQLYFPEGDGLHFVIGNVGGTTNTGFEIATKILPLPRLSLSAGLAYTDPKLTNGTFDASNAGYCLQIPSCAPRVVQLAPGFLGVNVHGYQLPESSKLTVNLAVDYSHPVTSTIDAFAHADFRYQDKQYTAVTLFNSSYQAATTHLNLRLGAARGPFTADLFVMNATNDQTPLNVVRNTEFTSFSGNFEFVGSLPPPRIYGAEILFHY